MEAVIGNLARFEENMEVHSATVEGPFVNGDEFAVIFRLDSTAKETGKRSTLEDVALYTMEDEKIVHERFLFKVNLLSLHEVAG